MKEYRELTEAQAWCAKHGFDGFVRWYDELLTFLAKRRSLPPEAYEGGEEPPPPREWSR